MQTLKDSVALQTLKDSVYGPPYVRRDQLSRLHCCNHRQLLRCITEDIISPALLRLALTTSGC